MQGHEGDDSIGVGWYLVGIGDQGDLLQEGRQRVVAGQFEVFDIALLSLVNIDSMNSGNEFLSHRNKLDEVFQPRLILRVFGVLQLGDVTGFFQDRVGDLVGPFPLPHHGDMVIHEANESSNLIDRSGC